MSVRGNNIIKIINKLIKVNLYTLGTPIHLSCFAIDFTVLLGGAPADELIVSPTFLNIFAWGL